MRNLRPLTAALLVAVVAACQTTSTTREWTTIERTTSRISVVGDDSIIRARDMMLGAPGGTSRYQERLRFANGALYFEELYNSQTVYGYSNADQGVLEDFAPHLAKYGINITAGDLKRTPFQRTHVSYVAKSSSTHTCVAFQSYFGDLSAGWGTKVIAGMLCEGPHVTAEKLEADTLSLLSRLRFDGGELNRTRT